ncbi:MAG: amidohydrolase [Clostridiales Family XIII bacterium]|jgi:predicted amidohydrolase YtcJ|nr:amidohydrolase [Clostridiales Family XIII bacterium]
MSIKADLVLKNANIHTMDKKNPTGAALAVLGDTILGVGSFEDFSTVIGADTEIIDLSGKTVLPGFNDNHSHPLFCAGTLSKVNLTGTRSHSEFFERLKARADKTPAGDWVEAFGYDEGLFLEGKEPGLAELDAAFPDHPVCIARVCQHVGLANSRALALRGYDIDSPDPPGGEIVREDGKLTGRLCETAFIAMKEVVPPLDGDQLAKLMQTLSGVYNSFGITSTTEMAAFDDSKVYFSAWGNLIKNNWLTVRIAAYCLEPMYRKFIDTGIPFPFGDDLLKFQGRKIILDGTAGAGTARMSEPSRFDGNAGITYYTQEQLDDMVWEAHSHGHQLSGHAIGDIAITMFLDAYKKAQDRLPRPDARHRIEHCSFCFPHLVERVINEGVYPLMNTGFLHYFGDTITRNYGEERVSQSFPFRSLLDGGLIVANGSDTPVTVLDPTIILHAAMVRKTASGASCGDDQRISAQEAVYAYTAAGAHFTFDEHKKGTLESGKLADIIVTDIDPTAVDDEPERVLEMKVEQTILGGKTVYRR